MTAPSMNLDSMVTLTSYCMETGLVERVWEYVK